MRDRLLVALLVAMTLTVAGTAYGTFYFSPAGHTHRVYRQWVVDTQDEVDAIVASAIKQMDEAASHGQRSIVIVCDPALSDRVCQKLRIGNYSTEATHNGVKVSL